MNLILLFPSDFVGKNRVRLAGRRFRHIRDVLNVEARHAWPLRVGLEGGLIGTGTVANLTAEAVELDVHLAEPPPPPLPVTLILALPRPNVVRRVLIAAASLGVKKIVFLNFYRVEKSLWNSSSLTPDSIREHLILGLEQGKDTVLPEVGLRERFKPFVEDELPHLVGNGPDRSLPLIAHPGSSAPCPKAGVAPVTLVIGPEGGFVPFELETLNRLGFQSFTLGPRILKVETVIPYILAKLF